MSFHYIKRKLVAFKPFFNLCKIIVDGLIQLSDIAGLMAKARVISIHGHIRISDSSWEVIDVNEE